MNFVCIGKIVNTHGIKGELRILSDFDQKEKVFLPNFKIYIGKEKKEETIKTYRHHKCFEMITMEGYTNINQVLEYKDKYVFVNRQDLNLKENEYLLEDLIDCEIIEDKKNYGKVIEIVYNKANILLKVQDEKDHIFYIPKNGEFIKKVDCHKKEIYTQNIQGLML